jgi:hypothetical protein
VEVEADDHIFVDLQSPKADKSTHCDSDFASNLPSWPFLETNAFDFSFTDLEIEHGWTDFQHTDIADLADDLPAFAGGVDHDQDVNANTTQGSTNNPIDLDLSTTLVSSFPSPSPKLHTISLGESPESVLDDPDTLASRLNEQTRHVLSIYEEPSENPWIKLIWPMVKDSEALYHAVVAMTYLYFSKSDYSARRKGLLHVRKSKTALEVELKSGNMQMEAALAATIALGFAETWDYGTSTTGRAHIRGARVLLQQSLANHSFAPSTSETPTRLNFLANTWIYIDVIARLTSDCGSPLSSEMLSLFGMREPYASAEEMDPLMGYASTLFPIIGRVGDLVGEIRARLSKRNSPIIISKAIELRKIIEAWAPAIDLEQVDDPTPNMSDAIQTAEAYRWSTLLLLQQAVPELPNLGSVGELGQRTLVYLATIPMTSQTVIVHTYPLMVAGTEAVDEDRAFVRERWRSMSSRMVAGIVDRCLEITEEVWRRRDAYLVNSESCSPNDAVRARLSSPILRSGSGDVGTHPFSPDITTSSGPAIAPPRALTKRSSSISSHFPISAAFKKGVDPLTRSGNVEYTVKGKLHWLGVMKDWDWEGE